MAKPERLYFNHKIVIKSDTMNKKKNNPKFPVGDMAQVCIIVPDLEKAVKNFYHIFGIGPGLFTHMANLWLNV